MKIKQRAAKAANRPGAPPPAAKRPEPPAALPAAGVYVLTADESGLLTATAAAHQAAYEAERNILMASIIRHRGLGGGAWHLDSGAGTLTRQS